SSFFLCRHLPSFPTRRSSDLVHRTNPRWQADLELCVKHQVPIVITSLGAASQVVEAVHSYGGLVFHDVTNQKHARKAAEAGVDRSEEHTSELQSRENLVCRLL